MKHIRTLIAVITLSIILIAGISLTSRISSAEKATAPSTSATQVQETVKTPISNITCGAATPCPAGMECWTLIGSGQEGPKCVTPDPQAWYCKAGTKPVVSKSDPPMISCQEK